MVFAAGPFADDVDNPARVRGIPQLLGEQLADAVSGADAAIGSRREPTSIVVKKGVRNTRGKLFIYYEDHTLKPVLLQNFLKEDFDI